MSKKNVEVNDTPDSILKYKSYSFNEIIAAGGPVAFAIKLGKNPQNIIKRLRKLPKNAFLTEEEAEEALKSLRESK